MSVRWVPTGLPQTAIADREPTASDDRTTGARLFSRWFYESALREWVCIDDSVGAAVWFEVAGAAGYQPADPTLSALAALSWTSGELALTLTAADTFTLRNVGASGANDILNRSAGDARYQSIADHAFEGIIDGDSNLSILSSHAYGLIRATSGTRTYTLPEIGTNSLPVGWWVRIKNRSGSAVTVNRGGSDTINAGGTSFSVTNNTSLFAVVVSGSAWEST